MEKHYDIQERFNILMNRYLKSGFKLFNSHEILEMILDFCVSKDVDTNVLAHNMINETGSLNKVFETSVKDLMKNFGLSKNAAVFINMMLNLSKRYAKNQFGAEGIRLNDSKLLLNYFKNSMIYETNEKTIAVFFDINFSITKSVTISDGVFNMPIKQILQKIIYDNLKYGVIVRKSMSTKAAPNNNDVDFVGKIKRIFDVIDCQLYDYIIISDSNEHFSFRENQLFGMGC